jgi:hypothetical protein
VQGEHLKRLKVDHALAAGTAQHVAATAAAAARSAEDVAVLAALNAWAVRPLATRADGGVRLLLALHRRYVPPASLVTPRSLSAPVATVACGCCSRCTAGTCRLPAS